MVVEETRKKERVVSSILRNLQKGKERSNHAHIDEIRRDNKVKLEVN